MTTENEPPKGSNTGKKSTRRNQMPAENRVLANPSPASTQICNWARERLVPGQEYGRQELIDDFTETGPNIRLSTFCTYLVAHMCTNAGARENQRNVLPDSDVFYNIGWGRYRLWNPENDPQPQCPASFQPDGNNEIDEELSEQTLKESSSEFAKEKDMQNYLSLNLDQIENGLTLYGIEFPAGGGRIDILAVGADGAYVVVELKVSRGYDQAVGQLSRYMGWVEENMCENGQQVRGVIIASSISEGLRLAIRRISGVALIKYQLAFNLERIR